MSDPVANDFAFIAKREAELRKEMQEALERPSCAGCSGVGWTWGSYLHAYSVCVTCNNPHSKLMPHWGSG